MIHESASKAVVIDERDEGTSTTENYTVEETTRRHHGAPHNIATLMADIQS